MGTMHNNKIGLAGELRVMSELLLRGHNPAKSYLEEGVDLVLQNGLRIEVKSGHRCHSDTWGKAHRVTNNYLFTLRGGKRKFPQNLENCDFVILWCIDDDCFLIIPKKQITGTCVGICKISDGGKGKYIQYKNKWDLLEVKDESTNRSDDCS